MSCTGAHFLIYLTHGTGVIQHHTAVGAVRRLQVRLLLLSLQTSDTPVLGAFVLTGYGDRAHPRIPIRTALGTKPHVVINYILHHLSHGGYMRYDTSIRGTHVTVRVMKLPPGEYTPGYTTRIFKFGCLVFSPPVCHFFLFDFAINLTSTSLCCDLYLSVDFHTYLFSICFYTTSSSSPA